MTDARLGGLGREALVADNGELRAGGIVREALVAGTGFAGRIGARSQGRGAPSITVAGATFLHGTATAQSGSRASSSLTSGFAGRASARSSLRVGLPSSVSLAGRISAHSSAQFIFPCSSWDDGDSVWDAGASEWDCPTFLAARLLAVSSGRAAATVSASLLRPQQHAVSII